MNELSEIILQSKEIAVICAIDATARFLLWAQIQRMQESGYDVHCVCSDGPYRDWITQRGVKIYPVTIKRSISPFSDIIALWKMYRYFRREKIQIVHTHTPKCSLLGQLAARMAGVPVVINTVHGFYFHENMKLLRKWFYITMERIAGKCSSMILSQNPEDIETAIKLGITTRDKIRLLGNGVDLKKFDPSRFDAEFRRAKRIEVGVPEKALLVGIIGRLVKEKGYLELFESMRNIMKRHENVWLIIIGPEDIAKSDRISGKTFVTYGISNKTRWLGGREDIPEILACMDIYTLPSWREGFPRSAIEAAAMGLPIVSTDIRGCRQVVEDGVNGLLVPVHDVGKLEDAIMKLLNDKELRIRMGKEGYLKSRKEFDETKVCGIIIETYKKATSGIETIHN